MTRLPTALLVLAASAIAQDHEDPAHRHDRRFTFVDESQHGATAGEFEFENVVTWGRGTRNNSGLDRFDFKHEIEYGLSESVLAAVDVVEWHISDEDGDFHTKYDMTGGELKFRLAHPRLDTVGAAFKTEIGIGPHELEWENVLVLDKAIGAWALAYNLKVETEFEGESTFHYEEGEVAVTQALGASYEVSPELFFGGEFLYEIPPEWSWGDRQNFFVGPNCSFRGEGWALTTTALFLADGLADELEFQLRVVFEFEF